VHVLLNWLAHGLVVSIATALTLRLIPPSRTQGRYCLLWAATVLVAALPVLPLIVASVVPLPAAHAAQGAATGVAPVLIMPSAWWTSATLALGLWLTWAAAYTARLVTEAFAVRRVVGECHDCPRDIQRRLKYWSRLRQSGRKTRLMLSFDVRAAAVLGCGSPVIALSPTLLDDLRDDDLDRIVIHEWAHVQRRDDMTRVLQALVQLIAGWHPAIWWLQRQIDVEREVACDEMAVAVTGSAKAYAVCLTTLAARRTLAARSLPALSVVSASGLQYRIMRILAARSDASMPMPRASTVAASAALTALAVVIVNLQIVRSAGAAVEASLKVGPIANAMTMTPPGAPIMPAERVALTSSSTTSVARSIPRLAADRDDLPLPAGDDPGPLHSDTLSDVAAPSGVAIVGSHPPVPAILLIATTPSLPIPNGRASDDEGRAPWTGAVEAGIAVGRGSQSAGIATSRVFTRVGKRVAGAF